MSLKRPAKEQPENFEFNSSSLDMANKIIAKYPEIMDVNKTDKINALSNNF